jgi:hypothetical protein
VVAVVGDLVASTLAAAVVPVQTVTRALVVQVPRVVQVAIQDLAVVLEVLDPVQTQGILAMLDQPVILVQMVLVGMLERLVIRVLLVTQDQRGTRHQFLV